LEAEALANHAPCSPNTRRPWVVLAGVLSGVLSVNFTFTLFTVALVRISRDLHTTQNNLTWAVTGPLLLVGVAAPTIGRVGDLRGHRRLYLIGLSGAVVCAAFTAVAWNGASLIAARLLSGIEGACTAATSWALLFSVFPPEERVKVLGWWSLVGAGGPVLGVAIGGPVIEAVGWRWIFVAQIPLVLVALLVNKATLPDTARQQGGSLDARGALLLTLATGGLLLGLNKGTDWGWRSPGAVGALSLFPIGMAAFVHTERRVPHPLVPLDWLRRRNFALPVAAQVLSNFAYMGAFFLTPIMLERVFGYGEGHAGVLQIARPLVFSLTAPAAGYLAGRVGERVTAVSGTLAVTVSMLVFAAVERGGGDLPVIAALALSGLGLGLATPSVSASIANAVEEHHLGVASAANGMVTQVGLVAGIQLLSTVQIGRQHAAGLAGSFSDAYLLAAGVAALGVVCAAFVRPALRVRPEALAVVPEGAALG